MAKTAQDVQSKLDTAVAAHREHTTTCVVCSTVGRPGSTTYPCTMGQVMASRTKRLTDWLASI